MTSESLELKIDFQDLSSDLLIKCLAFVAKSVAIFDVGNVFCSIDKRPAFHSHILCCD